MCESRRRTDGSREIILRQAKDALREKGMRVAEGAENYTTSRGEVAKQAGKYREEKCGLYPLPDRDLDISGPCCGCPAGVCRSAGRSVGRAGGSVIFFRGSQRSPWSAHRNGYTAPLILRYARRRCGDGGYLRLCACVPRKPRDARRPFRYDRRPDDQRLSNDGGCQPDQKRCSESKRSRSTRWYCSKKPAVFGKAKRKRSAGMSGKILAWLRCRIKFY